MLLVDTNAWLAAADRRSDRHRDCVTLLAAHASELASPVPVIAETSWLILDRLGPAAHQQFLGLVGAGHLNAVDLTAVDLTSDDWARSINLCHDYQDLRLDLMDASIVAIAERLGVTTIATMNHRDFAVVRPAHCDAFELIP